MTQASLSPDLHPAIRAPRGSRGAGARVDTSSEGTLWLVGLTSAMLLLASLLLLGLLAQGAVADASFSGFVSGMAVVIAATGVGAMAYVLVTARRAGYLGSSPQAPPSSSTDTPRGLHAVPAVPADLGRRRRQQLSVGRTARGKQAKAIAIAAAPASVPRASTPTPRQARFAAPRPAPARVAVPRPAPARVAVPASAPVRPRPAVRPAAPPLVRMPRTPRPRPHLAPRSAATTAFVRLNAPRVHPHAQAARFQVGAASVRNPSVMAHR